MVVLQIVLLSSACFLYNAAAPSQNGVGIVGGHSFNIEEIPYMAQLEVDMRAYEFVCGAALIAPNWVATVGNCLPRNDVSKYQVRVGTSKLRSGGKLIRVEERHLHPQFNFQTLDYDLVLLKLAENAPLGKEVQPIALIEANKILPAGTNSTILGWGITKRDGKLLSRDLQAANVEIIDHAVCVKIYENNKRLVTERMVCAGKMNEEGVDQCLGDGGGPLVVNGKLAGIVSWGHKPCGVKGFPSLYINISSLRSFIKEITGI